jgi:phosphate/sulfate permease
MFGSVLACPAGFTCGIWLAAVRLHAPHSTWKAAVGAVLGIAAVLLLAEPLRLNQDSRVLGTLLYLVPSVLALVGFNLPRRDKGSAGR